jgi:hypothetical protein
MLYTQCQASLSTLVDFFMEWLVFGISMDIKELRKYFELHCLPAVEVKVYFVDCPMVHVVAETS